MINMNFDGLNPLFMERKIKTHPEILDFLKSSLDSNTYLDVLDKQTVKIRLNFKEDGLDKAISFKKDSSNDTYYHINPETEPFPEKKITITKIRISQYSQSF